MPKRRNFVQFQWVAAILVLLFALGCSTTDVNRKRADRYFDQGEYDRAAEKYEQLLEELGPSFELYDALGRTAMAQENWAKAAGYFEEARALDSGFPDTYERLATCYARLEQEEKREEIWRALLRMRPNHPKANLALAAIEFDRANFERSVEHYRIFLAAEPENVVIRSSLGAALIAMQRYEAGSDELRRALEIDPACVMCRFNLGVAHLGSGKPERAEREFIVVTALEPASQDGWLYLAASYVRMGQTLRALETLEEATQHGFSDWARLEADLDFRPLVGDSRYQDLKARKPASPATP